MAVDRERGEQQAIRRVMTLMPVGRAPLAIGRRGGMRWPPPTWNDASEMPNGPMIFSPSERADAAVDHDEGGDARSARRRAARRVKPWVKWMKNGSTPIGLTIAEQRDQGLAGSSMDTGAVSALWACRTLPGSSANWRR